ncbi:GH92 family glycosyl hydrolase [Albibacterium profundi]|uniref:GH92 family glycosyl hydrolase n=1 Tax=Albibacterium profundi TaxID=3134906 RepID=A0ABV5CFH2_9SPHI
MKKSALYILFSIFFFASNSFGQSKLTSFVDPFIGTGGHGHTFPGAVVPFGMVQLSPDNGKGGWDWTSGYHYSDNHIAGFSHMHLSGTGIGDWLDISVMPLLKPLQGQDTVLVPATFSHRNEKASPGYYSVRLDNGILVELTASERVGYHRYTFPDNSEPTIRFDMGFHQNWDTPVETFIKKLNDSTLVGYRYSTGWASQQRVYFAARTSEPVLSFHLKGEFDIEVGEIPVGLTSDEKGKGVSSQLIFRASSIPKTVEMKVALSMTSTEKALLALDEIGHWNFNEAKASADEKWEKELEKIEIRTADQELKRIFYTALYHTAIAPTTYSDADGEYKNANNEVHRMPDAATRYTLFSLWDTFRALNPLFTLTQSERYTDMLNSMLAFHDENGLLPVWDLSTAETNTMTGYHAVPVLADAILKDWPGLDAERAYQAMKNSANQSTRSVPDYIEYGYVPQDKSGHSATMTLEYAYDDWAIAAVAKKMGKTKDYQQFSERALAYQRIFDENTGFMRAKNSDGSWALPFDPYYSEHDVKKAHYMEGNAWQHSFFVPHDVLGLKELYGGEGLEAKLDSLFTISSKVTGENASPDISGFIGQYAHGNEPSHHIAYMYTFIGKPWKTQSLVRQIVDSMYLDQPDGYAGNEDAGQMSAWAVWNIAGLYPANPVGGEYVIGSPMVDGVTFRLANDKTLEIRVLNNSPANKYVQSVQFNGKAHNKSYFMHKNLIKGGEIIFTMGPEPNENWGTDKSWWPASFVNTYQAVDDGDEVEEKQEKKEGGFFKSISEFFNNLFK